MVKTVSCKKKNNRGIYLLSLLVFLGTVVLFPAFLYATGTNYVLKVEGIEGELSTNVKAHLSLKQKEVSGDFRVAELPYLIASAPEEIATALQPFGYYSPIISINSNNNNPPEILVSVELGEPVLVHTLDIDCDGVGCMDAEIKKILADFLPGEGAILSHRQYEKWKELIVTGLLRKGFQDAVLSRHVVEVHPEKYQAGIKITVDTGPRYSFGEITYQCDFIDHALLEKILFYRQGAPLSPQILTQMRQFLLGSGYFDDVEIEADPRAADKDGKVPVTVSVTRGKWNRYGIGAGYGTDTGIRGNLEWYNRRVNEKGHQAEILLMPSERKSYFGGIYTIPFGDPRKERVSLGANWVRESFNSTDTEGIYSTLSYEYIQDAGEYSVYLRFSDEDYDIGGVTDHATVLSPGLKATLRWVDNRIAAGNGLSLTADISGGNSNLVSDTSFLTATLNAKFITSFLSSWRIICLTDLGSTAADSFYLLPPSYRFYAGGDKSVRGYGYKTIGPEDDMGNVIGGQYLLTYSVEIEKRLFDQWGAALFFDGGTVTNSWSLNEMKYGAGVGLRWFASFGQVRVDLAAPLDGEGGVRLHFNIGADF